MSSCWVGRGKGVSLPFTESYLSLCKEAKRAPLVEVRAHLGQPVLELTADRIQLEDWKLLLRALAADRTLHYIAIRSRQGPKNVLEQMSTEVEARVCKKFPVLHTKFLMTSLVDSLTKNISFSSALSSLLLSRIPIKYEFLVTLCQAIVKNNSIQHLALQHCPLFDQGCYELCKALQSKSNITTLDLTNCGITDEGATYVAELIKVHSNARYGESWKYSLRYSNVNSTDLPGLRRITLNQNSNLGDRGLQAILQVLFDDIWIRAVDMQQCDVTDFGCQAVFSLIQTNTDMEIFDLRGNKIEDIVLLHQLMEKLRSNLSLNKGSFNFSWLDEVKSVKSSLSQMTLSSSVNTPRKCSYQAASLSNIRSEASINSNVTDAPWRILPKQKNPFTVSMRGNTKGNLVRSRSVEPVSKAWTLNSPKMMKTRKEDLVINPRLPEAGERPNHVLSPKPVTKQQNGIIGVTKEQFKILNEFKHYSSALIKLPNGKRQHEINSTAAESLEGCVMETKNCFTNGIIDREVEEGGDKNEEQEPYENKAKEIFSRMLFGAKGGERENIKKIPIRASSAINVRLKSGTPAESSRLPQKLEVPTIRLSKSKQNSIVDRKTGVQCVQPLRSSESFLSSRSSTPDLLRRTSNPAADECSSREHHVPLKPAESTIHIHPVTPEVKTLHPLRARLSTVCLHPSPSELKRRDFQPMRAALSSVSLRYDENTALHRGIRALRVASSVVSIPQ